MIKITNNMQVVRVESRQAQKETSPAILAYLQKRQVTYPVYLSDTDTLQGLAKRVQQRVLSNKVKTKQKIVQEYWNEYGQRQEKLLETKKPVLSGFEDYLNMEDIRQEAYCLALEYIKRNYTIKNILSSKEWRKYHVSLYFAAAYRVARDLKDFIVRNYLNVQELSNIYIGDDGEEYTVEPSTSEYYINLFTFESFSYIETKLLLMDAIKTDTQRRALACILADIGRKKAKVNPKTYSKVRGLLKDALKASI